MSFIMRWYWIGPIAAAAYFLSAPRAYRKERRNHPTRHWERLMTTRGVPAASVSKSSVPA